MSYVSKFQFCEIYSKYVMVKVVIWFANFLDSQIKHTIVF